LKLRNIYYLVIYKNAATLHNGLITEWSMF